MSRCAGIHRSLAFPRPRQTPSQNAPPRMAAPLPVAQSPLCRCHGFGQVPMAGVQNLCNCLGWCAGIHRNSAFSRPPQTPSQNASPPNGRHTTRGPIAFCWCQKFGQVLMAGVQHLRNFLSWCAGVHRSSASSRPPQTPSQNASPTNSPALPVAQSPPPLRGPKHCTSAQGWSATFAQLP